MSEPLVSDDPCEAIEPLLPKEPPKPNGGRPRVPDRAALAGIIFVLRTGCPWLAPEGTELWQRHDLLATVAGLVGSWCVGAAPREAPQLVRACLQTA